MRTQVTYLTDSPPLEHLSSFQIVLIAAVALFAATLGGTLGFGTAVFMLPVLTGCLGLRAAVPVLGVAMVFAGGSRAAFSWHEIDWKATLAFSTAGIPMTVVGALLFANTASNWLDLAIAIVVVLLVPLRKWTAKIKLALRLRDLPWLGGVVGFFAGTGAVLGPTSTPFWLSYGLSKGSYLGTDGINGVLVHGTKTAVFFFRGAISWSQAVLGTAIGVILIVGSFAGRRLVERLSDRNYKGIIDLTTVALGCYMAWVALNKR